jgi:glutaredoxin-related protein
MLPALDLFLILVGAGFCCGAFFHGFILVKIDKDESVCYEDEETVSDERFEDYVKHLAGRKTLRQMYMDGTIKGGFDHLVGRVFWGDQSLYIKKPEPEPRVREGRELLEEASTELKGKNIFLDAEVRGDKVEFSESKLAPREKLSKIANFAKRDKNGRFAKGGENERTDRIWCPSHKREGRTVKGHWRIKGDYRNHSTKPKTTKPKASKPKANTKPQKHIVPAHTKRLADGRKVLVKTHVRRRDYS